MVPKVPRLAKKRSPKRTAVLRFRQNKLRRATHAVAMAQIANVNLISETKIVRYPAEIASPARIRGFLSKV